VIELEVEKQSQYFRVFHNTCLGLPPTTTKQQEYIGGAPKSAAF